MEIGEIVEVRQEFVRRILPSEFLERILTGEFFWVDDGVDSRVTLPVGMKLELVAHSTAFKRGNRVAVAVYKIVREQTTHQAQMLAEDYEGWLLILSEDKQKSHLTETSAP